MKNRKRPIILAVILMILLSGLAASFDTTALAEVRTIDLLRLFASGMLAGVLVVTVAQAIRQRRSGADSN